MQEPPLNIDKAMQNFAGGAEQGASNKMDEYAERILAGENPATLGVPEQMRAGVIERVTRHYNQQLETILESYNYQSNPNLNEAQIEALRQELQTVIDQAKAKGVKTEELRNFLVAKKVNLGQAS